MLELDGEGGAFGVEKIQQRDRPGPVLVAHELPRRASPYEQPVLHSPELLTRAFEGGPGGQDVRGRLRRRAVEGNPRRGALAVGTGDLPLSLAEDRKLEGRAERQRRR